MIDKTYDASAIESRIYAGWEASGAFQRGRPGRENADPYTIVIPPPNVTGSLHMGHALNDTLQDILVRFERMRGKDVLWQPGMDHAGIATQMVVERQMMERQEPGRREIGREAFVEKVWSWKAESGGMIINQLKRLGCSCDWSRERFTMDEGLSRAVLKTFVTLYRDGLIYKDKRLVNWDPKLLTAISDLEVQNVDQTAEIWYFRYPIKDQAGRFITVATTRPETMLGDTAVAVHPDDERYADLVGKMVILPLVGREIPIIADEYSDPEKGSGAVKITPAHDFNDFEVGRRHDLPMINILDAHAALNDEVPVTYRGLDRFDARKRVVADLDALGLLEKVEEVANTVPFGDRSNVVIEPWLTDQWYVDAATLAKPAIEAVETGKTTFVPKNWDKTYFEWMRNIQPWCISRQLWWGHQIPAWYGADGEVFVAETEDEAKADALAHYGDARAIERDQDVLDTWFSSALWPFSTLGWPDETPELARHYKTDVLVTGFDIIFFWVARMMMAGLHFMKDENGEPEVPFHTVYIHALVRDEKGQKMSKSKGNVMNPLELIDDFGADALRFTLAAMAAQGRDIKMARSRVEGYRNFATKLWNATRFCEMNECVRQIGFDPSRVEEGTNRWIVGEAEKTARAVTEAFEGYRFNEAAAAIYRFTWNTFCDWYLELSKPILNGADEAATAETRATAAWTLDQILTLLHPFMPFITEELWEKTGAVGPERVSHLIEAEWPTLDGLINQDADTEINWLIEAVTAIRSVRSEMNISPSAELPLVLVDPDRMISARVERLQPIFMRLARLSAIEKGESVPDGAIQVLLGQTVAALPVADVIDFSAEQARLEKDLKKLDGEVTGIDRKLGNEQFLSKAPDHVIEEQKTRRADALAKRATVNEALERLQSLS